MRIPFELLLQRLLAVDRSTDAVDAYLRHSPLFHLFHAAPDQRRYPQSPRSSPFPLRERREVRSEHGPCVDRRTSLERRLHPQVPQLDVEGTAGLQRQGEPVMVLVVVGRKKKKGRKRNGRPETAPVFPVTVPTEDGKGHVQGVVQIHVESLVPVVDVCFFSGADFSPGAQIRIQFDHNAGFANSRMGVRDDEVFAAENVAGQDAVKRGVRG